MNWDRANYSDAASGDQATVASQNRLLQESLDVRAEARGAGEAKVQLAGLFDFWKNPSSDALSELRKGPPPTSLLKDGDIIFHSSQSSQSEAIRLATNSPLSHVGILFKENGKWVVYEAVQPVKKTPLEQFAKRGEDGNYVVRRLKDADSALTDEALASMKGYLKSNLGKNYDLQFGWGDEKQYCSELVWKAYEHATGKRLGEPRPMRDFDISKPEVRKKVEERWGRKLPLNELMIAPSGIYDSKLLEPVRKR